MENYREYLPGLKSTTLFRDMTDEEIICVLEAMQPAIIEQKAGEMPTKPYDPEVSEAQGKMLRNLLGILAQKVMDVRKEKFEMMKEYEKKLEESQPGE